MMTVLVVCAVLVTFIIVLRAAVHVAGAVLAAREVVKRAAHDREVKAAVDKINRDFVTKEMARASKESAS